MLELTVDEILKDAKMLIAICKKYAHLKKEFTDIAETEAYNKALVIDVCLRKHDPKGASVAFLLLADLDIFQNIMRGYALGIISVKDQMRKIGILE